MANMQRLLRQVLSYIRKNPGKAQRRLHSAGETVKQRTGGRYNRHIDKATGMASRYLDKQSGRPGHGSPHNRNGGYGSGGSAPKYRP
ncbi:antitoxin [Streptomonospora litoralis]|uniref:Antitoxin n=1 Tax=Streptomonospora litoralis TaxID=2498135 RepID=A0A4P6QAE5_9ACTN|nr:antitoxin [Streptomonospora litoralis]QBI56489.1 hypothetical protein EKD16_23715 [Streptomonospora litoralis]